MYSLPCLHACDASAVQMQKQSWNVDAILATAPSTSTLAHSAILQPPSTRRFVLVFARFSGTSTASMLATQLYISISKSMPCGAFLSSASPQWFQAMCERPGSKPHSSIDGPEHMLIASSSRDVPRRANPSQDTPSTIWSWSGREIFCAGDDHSKTPKQAQVFCSSRVAILFS